MEGTKTFEFRKSRCHEDVEDVLIYCTCPVKKIVGRAKIKDILEGTPEEIWAMTEGRGGVEKEFFEEYYHDRTKAIAFELEDVERFKQPLGLNDVGIGYAPQSFAYIDFVPERSTI